MEKENQRILLTKQLLKNSLVTMLEKNSIHKVSIRELCEYAGINRTTFYNHYGNQYDLLTEMENELLLYIQESIPKTSKINDGEDIRQLTGLLTYLEENVKLSRLLINNNVDREFSQKLLHLPLIQEVFKQYPKINHKADQISYVKDFVFHGAYNMVCTWINRDQREPAEEISKLLLDIIYKVI